MRATRTAVPILAVVLAWGFAAAASAQEAPARIKLLPLRVSGARLSAEQSTALTDALVAKLKKYFLQDVNKKQLIVLPCLGVNGFRPAQREAYAPFVKMVREVYPPPPQPREAETQPQAGSGS